MANKKKILIRCRKQGKSSLLKELITQLFEKQARSYAPPEEQELKKRITKLL